MRSTAAPACSRPAGAARQAEHIPLLLGEGRTSLSMGWCSSSIPRQQTLTDFCRFPVRVAAWVAMRISKLGSRI